MITDERMTSYLHSIYREDAELIQTIEREAKGQEVPIVRAETKELLKVLILNQKPMKILEVGTAIGFSAIYMCQYLPEGGRIDTIEKYEPRIEAALKNFERAGVTDRIRLLTGDAAEVMCTLDGEYDMIFMDAAKGQYIHFLPDALRLLKSGGMMISDNVLQDGDVLESRYAVEKRNRTIHSRMRDYIYALTHHDALETVVLPLGDGVALSTKISNGEND
ncbi:MAG: O-methyltransferase [Lachnospiraceae bacterium]|nr:O-methyltransferase [Lachnospiraceae bacterium]